MVSVEVARQPVPKANRHVLDQRLRMQRAIVEGHGVDQRLERRTGRASGPHEVDLPGAAEEIVAAQPGHDTTGAVVEHDHGDLRAVGERAAFLMRELAQRLLQLEAQGGRHDGARRLTGQPRGEMGRLHR